MKKGGLNDSALFLYQRGVAYSIGAGEGEDDNIKSRQES